MYLRLVCSLSHCFYWRSPVDLDFLTFSLFTASVPQGPFPRRCLPSALAYPIYRAVPKVIHRHQLHNDDEQGKPGPRFYQQELSSTPQGKGWPPKEEDGVVDTIWNLEDISSFSQFRSVRPSRANERVTSQVHGHCLQGAPRRPVILKLGFSCHTVGGDTDCLTHFPKSP